MRSLSILAACLALAACAEPDPQPVVPLSPAVSQVALEAELPKGFALEVSNSVVMDTSMRASQVMETWKIGRCWYIVARATGLQSGMAVTPLMEPLPDISPTARRQVCDK